MTCPYGHDDGAYVLGALSPAERSAYENHLAECLVCAASVARLAPMPGLLGRVDPAALPPEQARSTRLPQLFEEVSRQRQRRTRARRWRLVAAVAAAVVLAVSGSAVWYGAVVDPAPPAPAMVMEPAVAEVPVTAQLAVEPVAGGTEVRMACQYPATYESPPRVFRLVAVGPGGATEQVSSWTAGPGDKMALSGMTRFDPADLVRLEVHGADGAVLLRYAF